MSASAQKVVYQDAHELINVVHSDGQSHRNVLLIDEQAHVLRVMRLNLRRHGYDVEMAMSSENALHMVQKNRYDVVIITSDLPDMSARKLCELFELKAGSKCPLTLVGAVDNDSWINQSLFAEKLEKPVSLRWIVARLSEAFGDFNK
jgi:two-component system KDP operon response regulator KdpE